MLSLRLRSPLREEKPGEQRRVFIVEFARLLDVVDEMTFEGARREMPVLVSDAVKQAIGEVLAVEALGSVRERFLPTFPTPSRF